MAAIGLLLSSRSNPSTSYERNPRQTEESNKCMPANAELEEIIASGYSEGRTRFGDLGLDLKTYTQRIHAIVEKHLGSNPAPESVISFVQALHRRDLYLATACAHHSLQRAVNSGAAASPEQASRSWMMLEMTYKGFIRDLSRFFFRKGFVAQDLADNIVADLFFPDRSGSSRIVSYDGRSSLSTWLRAVISNRAINAQRVSTPIQSVEVLADIPDEPALQNMNSGLTSRYQSLLHDALTKACSNLALRERLILLWRYEDGLQLGQIAKLLGIHQSNVTRQLERLQAKLREQVVSILSTQHSLSLAAIEECLNDIVENPQTMAILEFIKGVHGPRPQPQGPAPCEPGARAKPPLPASAPFPRKTTCNE
jgi:RNA polymerase sigma factor (sigma-70 family)